MFEESRSGGSFGRTGGLRGRTATMHGTRHKLLSEFENIPVELVGLCTIRSVSRLDERRQFVSSMGDQLYAQFCVHTRQ